MKGNAIWVLDALAATALAAAAIVFATGGTAVELGGVTLRARSAANPLAWALILAGVRRLLVPADSSDGLVRAVTWARARAEALWGRGCERLGAVAAFRLDALVFALVGASVVGRGIAHPLLIEGDSVGYYSWVRSAWIDGDLDFTNEYRDHDARQQWLHKRTPIGRAWNPFPVGPAVAWAPFFALGDAVARLADPSGRAIPHDGYSAPYVHATAGATWVMGLAGVALLYRLLLRHFDRTSALVATLAVVFAGPFACYLVHAPHNSHTQSFFAAVVFLHAWVAARAGASPARWAALGLAGGLVAITRWQDTVLWALPLATLLAGWTASVRGGRALAGLAAAVWRGLAFLAAAIAVLVPQLLAFKLVHGFWLGVPQGDDYLRPLPYWLWPSLFSWKQGLFSWSPLLLVAGVGLLAAALGRRPWAVPFAFALAAQLWANGSVSEWWGGHAFGARRLISALPFFAFGFAELLARARSRPPLRRALVAVAAVAVVLNHVLLRQWLAARWPHGVELDPLRVARLALEDLVATNWRLVLLDEPVFGLLWARIDDFLGLRLPLVLASAAFYALARRRARARLARWR